MIRLKIGKPNSIDDARDMLQTAIDVEFGTLPPYLYALYTILPGTNPEAMQRIEAVVHEELTHVCLASNILNALGGNPVLRPQRYPGPLAGDVGSDPAAPPPELHLYPFSREAMEQAMAIEQPEDLPVYPAVWPHGPGSQTEVTIGQFYEALNIFLDTLPQDAWVDDRNQISSRRILPGQIRAVRRCGDAYDAIVKILNEGEGALNGLRDLGNVVAHYFRFAEVARDGILTLSSEPPGYAFGPERLGVCWAAAYPAIVDPGRHDFGNEPAAARAAQDACNAAYSAMVAALQAAMNGTGGTLGKVMRAMLALRTAAHHALTVPLADGRTVAGPAFLCQPGRKEDVA